MNIFFWRRQPIVFAPGPTLRELAEFVNVDEHVQAIINVLGGQNEVLAGFATRSDDWQPPVPLTKFQRFSNRWRWNIYQKWVWKFWGQRRI